MGAFWGCCVIAAAIVYVGKKIGRVLWHLLAVVENDVDRRALRDGMDINATPLTPPKTGGRNARVAGRW